MVTFSSFIWQSGHQLNYALVESSLNLVEDRMPLKKTSDLPLDLHALRPLWDMNPTRDE